MTQESLSELKETTIIMLNLILLHQRWACRLSKSTVIDYLNQKEGATLESPRASSGNKDTHGVLKYRRLRAAPRDEILRKINRVNNILHLSSKSPPYTEPPYLTLRIWPSVYGERAPLMASYTEAQIRSSVYGAVYGALIKLSLLLRNFRKLVARVAISASMTQRHAHN